MARCCHASGMSFGGLLQFRCRPVKEHLSLAAVNKLHHAQRYEACFAKESSDRHQYVSLAEVHHWIVHLTGLSVCRYDPVSNERYIDLVNAGVGRLCVAPRAALALWGQRRLLRTGLGVARGRWWNRRPWRLIRKWIDRRYRAGEDSF